MKKRLYKKGAKEALLSFGGALLAVIVIVLAVYLIFKFSAMFTQPEEQATIATYNTLISQISRMTHKTGTDYIASDFWINVGGSDILVAFNKDENKAIDACYPVEEIPKPEECGEHACLCRYKGHYEDFIGNNVKKRCTPLPYVDYIISLNYADFYYKNENIFDTYAVGPKVYKNVVGKEITFDEPSGYPDDDYSYLFMYGHCDAWWIDENFGKQRIYLEKFYDRRTKKTYIFIAAYTPGLKLSREKKFEELLKIIKPTDPEEYFKKIINYCGDRSDTLWYLEVIFSAELLKQYPEYKDKLANYEDCIKQANEVMDRLKKITEEDIKKEREEMPIPIYHEGEIEIV